MTIQTRVKNKINCTTTSDVLYDGVYEKQDASSREWVSRADVVVPARFYLQYPDEDSSKWILKGIESGGATYTLEQAVPTWELFPLVATWITGTQDSVTLTLT